MDTLRILTCDWGMKRLITLLALLLLPVWSQAAYADNIPTFNAQININFEFVGVETVNDSTFAGPGVSLSANGGTACPNFCLQGPLTPGSSLTPDIGLDFESVSGTVTLGGHQTICSSPGCDLIGTDITALKSITLPTNGQNFTVTVPAVLSGPILGSVEVTGQMFRLQASPEQLELFFSNSGSFPPGSGYQFGGAVFSTPEPSTFGLMAAGLVGILGVALKRRKLLALSH